jgi:ketosteroid isomerase-like protein
MRVETTSCRGQVVDHHITESIAGRGSRNPNRSYQYLSMRSFCKPILRALWESNSVSTSVGIRKRLSVPRRLLGCEIYRQKTEKQEICARKPANARDFANEWVEAWNSHDLDRVMSHYASDFEITTPFIRAFMGAQAGDTLKGKMAIREYWTAALVKVPDLKFELIDVADGASSVTLYYKSINNKKGMEVMFFDHEGKVSSHCSLYVVNILADNILESSILCGWRWPAFNIFSCIASSHQLFGRRLYVFFLLLQLFVVLPLDFLSEAFASLSCSLLRNISLLSSSLNCFISNLPKSSFVNPLSLISRTDLQNIMK